MKPLALTKWIIRDTSEKSKDATDSSFDIQDTDYSFEEWNPKNEDEIFEEWKRFECLQNF